MPLGFTLKTPSILAQNLGFENRQQANMTSPPGSIAVVAAISVSIGHVKTSFLLLLQSQIRHKYLSCLTKRDTTKPPNM